MDLLILLGKEDKFAGARGIDFKAFLALRHNHDCCRGGRTVVSTLRGVTAF